MIPKIALLYLSDLEDLAHCLIVKISNVLLNNREYVFTVSAQPLDGSCFMCLLWLIRLSDNLGSVILSITVQQFVKGQGHNVGNTA